MFINLGITKPGSTIYLPFDSFGSSGQSLTMSGLAVTDIEIYRDGSTTQRSSDAGYTLLDTDGIDFDGLTGIHGISIDLADNTDAGFYRGGGRYWVVISSITINAQTVSFVLGHFEIGYPDAILNTNIATLASQTSFTLTAGSANNDAYNGCIAVIHDVASAIQVEIGVVDDYTGSTKTVTLLADPGIFTVAATDNISLYPPVYVKALAAESITAGVVAANAIGAAELAADAVAEIADGVWDELRSGHSTSGSFGESHYTIESGQAAAGTLSTTQMTTNLTEATDDHYIGRLIIWVTGVLLRQVSTITDYVGATKRLDYDAVTEAPTAGDRFILL